MAKVSISLKGIDQAITNLNYRENSIKQRILLSIRAHYLSENSIADLASINTDDIVKSIWNTGNDTKKIRSKRRNFSSIKSSINADFKTLSRKNNNPENITINPANIFDMSEDAKNDLLKSFSNAVKTGEVDLNQVSELLKVVTDFLSNANDISGNSTFQDIVSQVKEIISKVSENMLPDAGKTKREKHDTTDQRNGRDGDGKYEEDESGESEETIPEDEIEEIELDQGEEFEDIELDKDEDIEEVELDEDEALEEIDELDENKDLEQVEIDEDIEDIEINEDEDIKETKIDEDEDLEEIKINEDLEKTDIGQGEDTEGIGPEEQGYGQGDGSKKSDGSDKDEPGESEETIPEDEIEEIELDQGEEFEDIELDKDEDIEEVELDEDEALEEIDELEEDKDLEQVEIDEDDEFEDIKIDDNEELEEIEINEDEIKDLENYKKEKELAEHFDEFLGESDKKYNAYLIVPAGTYTVGSKRNFKKALRLQKIQMPEIYIAQYPVTNSLFEIFVEKTGYITLAEKKGFGTVFHGRFKKGKKISIWKKTAGSTMVPGACWHQPQGPGSTLHGKKYHPVVQISIDDAWAFASWIGRRLPTEAEWEACARTDIGFRYPWGNKWKDGCCNIEKSSFSDTTPVDRYDNCANEFNIVDLLGNVMEWTSDREPVSFDPDNTIMFNIAKGGGWTVRNNITITSRSLLKPGFTSNITGFRCISEKFL